MTWSTRVRSLRIAAATALAFAALLPAAIPAAAQTSPVTLQVGTTQDLDATNPFNTELVVGYEAFQLTYNLLIEFDKDAHPAAGLRRQLGAIGRPRHLPHPRRDELVRRQARDLEGRLLLVGPRHGGDQGRVVHRLGLPRSRRQGRGRHQDRMPGRLARSSPTRRTSRTGSTRCTCRSCPSTSGASWTTRRSPRSKFDAAARGHRAVHARRVEDRPVRALRPQRELLGQAGLRRRGRAAVLPGQPRTPWSRR